MRSGEEGCLAIDVRLILSTDNPSLNDKFCTENDVSIVLGNILGMKHNRGPTPEPSLVQYKESGNEIQILLQVILHVIV